MAEELRQPAASNADKTTVALQCSRFLLLAHRLKAMQFLKVSRMSATNSFKVTYSGSFVCYIMIIICTQHFPLLRIPGQHQ